MQTRLQYSMRDIVEKKCYSQEQQRQMYMPAFAYVEVLRRGIVVEYHPNAC